MVKIRIRFNSMVSANNLAREQQLIKRIELAQTKRQIEQLATFLPDEVLKIPLEELDLPKCFVGVLLYASVAGFTPLCEKYNKTVQGGIYRLTATMNAYIGAIVEVIYFYGGDVIRFTGDSFLCMWKVWPDDCLYETLHGVVVCATFIQEYLGKFETEINIPLTVRLAISCGNMTFFVIGSAEAKSYVLLGTPLNDLTVIERSVPGDIIVGCGAWEHMLQERYEISNISGGHVKILNIFYKRSEIEQKEHFDEQRTEAQELCKKHIIHRKALHAFKKFDDNTTDIKIAEQFVKSLPLRKQMIFAPRKWIVEDLKPFILPIVENQVIEFQPTDYLTEMREITTLTVSIMSSTSNETKLAALIDRSFQKVVQQVQRVHGMVSTVTSQNKEIVIYVFFGIRGNKQELESQQCLISAHKIVHKLRNLLNVQSISAAVTNGLVYCGVVGHPMRREYCVIGSSVLDARRMVVAYRNKITCDYRTFRDCKLSSFYFQILPESADVAAQYDGYCGNTYEYSEAFEKIHRIIAAKHTLIGRTEEMAMLRNIVFDPDKVFGYIAACVHGDSKIGISTLLRSYLSSLSDEKDLSVASLELGGSKPVPYYCVSRLYRQLYNNTARIDSKEMASIQDLPHDLWSYEEIVYGPDEDVAVRKFKILNYFRDIVKFTARSYSVIVIDNVESIDQKSWEILELALAEGNIRLICGAHFKEQDWDLQYKLSLNNQVKLVELEPLQSTNHVPQLACKYLNVDAIPRRLVQLLTCSCHGLPGQIQVCLLSLLNNDAIKIQIKKANEVDLQKYIFVDQSDVTKNRSVMVVDETEKSVNLGCSEDYTVTTITLLLFHSYTPYQQTVIKTSAVIGELFARQVLIAMLRYPSENIINSVIQHLYEHEIFDCGSSYINGKNIELRKLCCRCPTDMEVSKTMRDKFPKYALCRILHFKNKLLHRVAYNMLPANQRKELHLRITDVMEHMNNRCPDCRRNNSTAIIRLRKFRDVMNQCKNVQTNVLADDEGTASYPSVKDIVRENIIVLPPNSTKADEVVEGNPQTIPKRKMWDPTLCHCIEIFTRLYKDLIYHSEMSGHLGKQIFFTMQFGIIMTWINEYAEAIKMLLQANELCMTDARLRESQMPTGFRELNAGKIHQFLANSYIKLKQLDAAKNHLFIALRQYSVPMMSMNYICCSRLLMRRPLTNFKNVRNRRMYSNYLRRDFARCMSLLSTVFVEEGNWRMAEKAVLHTVYLLRTSYTNSPLICQAYMQLAEIYSLRGDEHTCLKLVHSVSHDIIKLYTMGTTNDVIMINSICRIRMHFSYVYGDLADITLLAYRTIELNNMMQAHYNNINTMQMLSHVLLLQGHYEDSRHAARMLFNMNKTNPNPIILLGYYTSALTYYLDTGFYFEKTEDILKFAQDKFQARTGNYTDQELFLIITIYLHYTRASNWTEAPKWKQRILDSQLNYRISPIFRMHMYFVEALMIEYVHDQRIRSNPNLPQAQAVISRTVYTMAEQTRKYPILRIRALIMKAYYLKIVGKRAYKDLKLARKLASKHGDKLDYLRTMQCQNHWGGGYSFGRQQQPMFYGWAVDYGNIDRAQLLYPLPIE